MGFGDDSLKVLMQVGLQGPISRTQISRMLDLERSRVTRLCNSLLENNLIHEIGRDEKSTAGRKSVLLELKDGGHLLCGALVSRSSRIEVVLIDLRANVVAISNKTDLPPDSPPETVVEAIVAGLEECYRQRPEARELLVGMGVGVSGLVHPEQGVIHACQGFLGLREFNLIEALRERVGLPIYLNNEVAMSTLAELWFGNGRGCANFMYVALGPGVRAGLVIDGQLVRGATGNAGELGHMTYEPNGPICYCGNPGCVEMYVSEEALEREANRSLRNGRLDPRGAESSAEHTVETIFQQANAGDRRSLALMRRICEPIGRVLASSVNLFDPERLIIGGSFAAGGQLLLDQLQALIQRHALEVMAENVSIQQARFLRNSTAIGGGGLVLQKICEGEAPLRK